MKLNEINDDKLNNVYEDNGVRINIGDGVVGSTTYVVGIKITNNKEGSLNVYVDNSLKWTKYLSSDETEDYYVMLYPKDLGMAVDNKYLIGVSFGKDYYECFSYLYPGYVDSFDSLSKGIKNAISIFDLNQDYFAIDNDDNEGIVINKNIIINGNGHSISGSSKCRIFDIKSSTVTLMNIVFKNGFNSNGGAIKASKSNLKIINCTFINNFADETGGAIYGEVSSLLITECSFISSITDDYGVNDCGFINLSGKNICIDNCTFGIDYYQYGEVTGIKLNGNNISIKNCHFDKTGLNQIISISGNDIEISDCEFNENKGALILLSNVNSCLINNCYFYRNNDILINLINKNNDCSIIDSTFKKIIKTI